MLSRDEITHLIGQPEDISADSLASLEKLALKYPYTQLFSILLLKGLKKNKDISFEEQLAAHSYRISNRVQLYKLVNTASLIDVKPAPIEDVDVKRTASDLHKEDELSEIPTEVEKIETPASFEEIETIIPPSPILEQELPIKEEETDEITPEKDNLEENILHHAFAANFQLEELSPEEEEKLATKKDEVKGKVEENIPIKKPKEDTSNFTNWLHSNVHFEEENSIEKEEIEAVVNDFSDFDPSSELFGEVKKPKTEFFSPIKKAKESLAENALPVSETLAKVYTLQGNYPKAISAYEQLSLIYPEKKFFFANLIIDLKKKINK